MALVLLENEDNEISVETVDFIQQFVDRHRQADYQISDYHMRQIISSTVKKMRYPDDYNFDHQGQDEAECDDYVNELKAILESAASTSPPIVLSLVQSRLEGLNDQNSVRDAELTIRLLYNLGECLPADYGPQKFSSTTPNELQKLVALFVRCSVPQHHTVSDRKRECNKKILI